MSEIDDLYLAEDGLGLAAALRGGCVSASELLEAALARAASGLTSASPALTSFELTPTLVFLLYQKGRNSRIFQAQDG